jgi:hypothetical protein
MEVFGVSGERFEGADPSSTTQDFFLRNAPMIEPTDIHTCLDIMQLQGKCFDSPTSLVTVTKLRTDAIRQDALAMLLNTNIIRHEFFTQSAFRFKTW